MFTFQDWFYCNETDFNIALDYEVEHPDWQVGYSLSENDFPAFVCELPE